jgi:hypothetical protein
MELSEKTVTVMLVQAHAKGIKAAAEKLDEMRAAGPKYQVIDEANPTAHIGDPGWQMLDVCGFAWVHVNEKGNTRKMRLLKKVAEQQGHRMYKSYYGGWDILHAHTGRQEMGVNEAYATAAAEELRKYGYDAYKQSRID